MVSNVCECTILILCSAGAYLRMMLQDEVEMLLPIAIGDYTDFFSSMHHAKNCGTIFRGPQNPISPNWYVNMRCVKQITDLLFCRNLHTPYFFCAYTHSV